jgi:hypothetical protein
VLPEPYRGDLLRHRIWTGYVNQTEVFVSFLPEVGELAMKPNRRFTIRLVRLLWRIVNPEIVALSF